MDRMELLVVRWEASKPNSRIARGFRAPRRLPRRTLGETTRAAGLVLGDSSAPLAGGTAANVRTCTPSAGGMRLLNSIRSA